MWEIKDYLLIQPGTEQVPWLCYVWRAYWPSPGSQMSVACGVFVVLCFPPRRLAAYTGLWVTTRRYRCSNGVLGRRTGECGVLRRLAHHCSPFRIRMQKQGRCWYIGFQTLTTRGFRKGILIDCLGYIALFLCYCTAVALCSLSVA